MNVFTTLLLLGVVASGSARVAPHIVGGIPASTLNYPYIGSIFLRGSNSDIYHICTGVLYTADKILTAAHALNAAANNYVVAFGLDDFADPNNSTLQTRNVSSYTIHPGFDPNIANGYPNDIAVIRLESPLDISESHVGTIGLADGSEDFVGQQCTLLGWGALASGEAHSNELRKADMTVIDSATCDAEVTAIGGQTNAGHVCTKEPGYSVCAGDSGGALVCSGVLKGLASFGDVNCTPEIPSIFSKISYFYDWIRTQ